MQKNTRNEIHERRNRLIEKLEIAMKSDNLLESMTELDEDLAADNEEVNKAAEAYLYRIRQKEQFNHLTNYRGVSNMCKLILRETGTEGLFQDQAKRFHFVGSTIPFLNPQHAERFGHYKALKQLNDAIGLSELENELQKEVVAHRELLNHPVLRGAHQ